MPVKLIVLIALLFCIFLSVNADDIYFCNGKYSNADVSFYENNTFYIGNSEYKIIDIASIYFRIIPEESEKQSVVCFKNGESVFVDSVDRINEKVINFKFNENMFIAKKEDLSMIILDITNPLTHFAENNEKDCLVLNSRETISGKFISADTKEVKFESEIFGEVKIPIYTEEGFLKINMIAFGNWGKFTEKDLKQSCVLMLADGKTKLKGKLKKIQGDIINISSESIGDFSVGKTAVKEMKFIGGKSVYLSDIAPDNYSFAKDGTVNWGYKNDQNCFGTSIKIYGKAYRKGLGLHAKSEIVYTVPKGYSKFSCAACIDSDIESSEALLGIFLDGEEVYSKRITKTADSINIEVKEGSKLKIIADISENKKSSWLDLADAKFTK